MAAHGWDDPAKPKLWRYNQHYFDDLNAERSAERSAWHQALITDWIAANPPGHGTGWEPYPTSLRIVNWVKWALAGNTLDEAARHSLAIQSRWLTRRLEWHLLGNHLFANAKALIFAGLWFDGPEAAGWLEKGTRILAREIPEQILPDGGQFELSPMYHALALEDMLDLVNIARAFGRDDLADHWAAPVPAMLEWLAAMTHPDGDLAFFNDTATGIAPANDHIFTYAEGLGFARPVLSDGSRHLAASGYVRLTAGPAVLIADLARVGPDYLPGHAHADTLSFELSLWNQRIFVNSGTSVYGADNERLRQRGTAAHNTVVVAEKNSSEVWGGFRVGARARPHNVKCWQNERTLFAEGEHDGYTHLQGNPHHRRRWALSENQLTIEDHVTSTPLPSEAYFHIHPAIRVEIKGENHGSFVLPDGSLVSWQAEGGKARVISKTWHPEFGSSQENRCLIVPLRDGKANISLNWK